MAEEGKRVEVRFGAFACSIEGYDNPVEQMREILTLMQRMISETPALTDAAADFDPNEVKSALDAGEAGEDSATPGVVIIRSPEQDGTAEQSQTDDVVDSPEIVPDSSTTGEVSARSAEDDVQPQSVAGENEAFEGGDNSSDADTEDPAPDGSGAVTTTLATAASAAAGAAVITGFSNAGGGSAVARKSEEGDEHLTTEVDEDASLEAQRADAHIPSLSDGAEIPDAVDPGPDEDAEVTNIFAAVADVADDTDTEPLAETLRESARDDVAANSVADARQDPITAQPGPSMPEMPEDDERVATNIFASADESSEADSPEDAIAHPAAKVDEYFEQHIAGTTETADEVSNLRSVDVGDQDPKFDDQNIFAHRPPAETEPQDRVDPEATYATGTAARFEDPVASPEQHADDASTVADDPQAIDEDDAGFNIFASEEPPARAFDAAEELELHDTAAASTADAAMDASTNTDPAPQDDATVNIFASERAAPEAGTSLFAASQNRTLQEEVPIHPSVEPTEQNIFAEPGASDEAAHDPWDAAPETIAATAGIGASAADFSRQANEVIDDVTSAERVEAARSEIEAEAATANIFADEPEIHEPQAPVKERSADNIFRRYSNSQGTVERTSPDTERADYSDAAGDAASSQADEFSVSSDDAGMADTNIFASSASDAPIGSHPDDPADVFAASQASDAQQVSPGEDATSEQLRVVEDEPANQTSSSSANFSALLRRVHGNSMMGAPGEDDGDQPAPEAIDPGNITAADLAQHAGSSQVSDLLAASAAWLTLAGGKPRFSRRDVMEIFETIPGEHPRTLEARIKGYGKLVRSGTLILIDDGVFAMAQNERDRFEGLLSDHA